LGIRKAGKGERRSVVHKRLLYCVNVNRTSLDHLLLGEAADIDKLSNGPSIARADIRARPTRDVTWLIAHQELTLVAPVPDAGDAVEIERRILPRLVENKS
jgi:hypothetical protein